MIAFDNIDTFNSSSELCIVIPQRYVFDDLVDLRSKRLENSSQQFKSVNSTATTLYHSLDIKIEQLSLNRNQLLEKRKKILKSYFFYFSLSKKREIALIDKELDSIEHQIILLQKPDFDQEIADIKTFLKDSESRIQKYNSTIDPII